MSIACSVWYGNNTDSSSMNLDPWYLTSVHYDNTGAQLTWRCFTSTYSCIVPRGMLTRLQCTGSGMSLLLWTTTSIWGGVWKQNQMDKSSKIYIKMVLFCHYFAVFMLFQLFVSCYGLLCSWLLQHTYQHTLSTSIDTNKLMVSLFIPFFLHEKKS